MLNNKKTNCIFENDDNYKTFSIKTIHKMIISEHIHLKGIEYILDKYLPMSKNAVQRCRIKSYIKSIYKEMYLEDYKEEKLKYHKNKGK